MWTQQTEKKEAGSASWLAGHLRVVLGVTIRHQLRYSIGLREAVLAHSYPAGRSNGGKQANAAGAASTGVGVAAAGSAVQLGTAAWRAHRWQQGRAPSGGGQ